MKLYPILSDAVTRREQIHKKALEGVTASFPFKVRDYTIELDDVQVQSRDYGPEDQKKAIMEGRSLFEPVKANLVMRGADGKILDRAKNYTVLRLPYLTERHTFVLDGNEYQVANQIRMKPGVYTRRKANDEVEATFNLSKGSNFRLSLDAEQGHPYMEYGTTRIPLYPVLRKIGVPHEEIAKTWGAPVADANKKAFVRKGAAAFERLYGKLVPPSRRNLNTEEEKAEAIRAAYADTAMDPEVTQATLGKAYSKVTPDSLLVASKKLLDIYRQDEMVDDRDSLAFKTFHSTDDFIKERIQLDARSIASKVRGRAASKTTIKTLLPPAPFSSGIRSFLTGSQLSAIPTQINPMEIIDQSVKVTSLGEGGISSERAVPMDARQVHATHFGILDPVRTPESFNAGVDIRASMLTMRDDAGNLYTPARDVKSGQYKYLSAKEVAAATVAFPKQKMEGSVEVMRNGQVRRTQASNVQYQLYDTSQLYSPATNLVPLQESMQGNRTTMAAKMQTQALPLVERDQPWVQSAVSKLLSSGAKEETSFERELGKLVVPTASVGGRVAKIDSQFIYIDPSGRRPPPTTLTVKRAGAVKRQKTVKGVTLKLELEPGDTRTGTRPDGTQWKKTMYLGYGYIPRTVGDDDECVDFYLKEDGDFETVYVVHQVHKDGKPDEDKVMLGFTSAEDAEKAYRKHVPAWCFGSMDEFDWEEFNEDYLTERQKTAAEKDYVKIPYSTNFPFASKTSLHHTLNVKEGDRVTQDQRLGDSNFTRDGTLALGKNMRVGYLAYYGQNSNDAVVISEGAAKKMTSEHMYKEVLDVDRDTTLGTEIHRVHYGSKYTAEQYRKLDASGVVRRGAKVQPGDIIIAGVRKGKPSATDMLLGNLKKTLANPYREEIHTWNHDFEGEVIDVYVSPRRVVVTVRTFEPMRIGDKLAGRHGNKGVVSQIIPDDRMVHDEQRRPLDIMYTSLGVVSRINPSQVIETAVAKVAEKTGKPLLVESFSGRDNVQWAKDLLKQHGLKDKETVFDPVSGKKIPGVLVGPQYTYRLFKTTDSNYSARGVEGYDVNQQPTKGGTEGAKGLGQMEFNALIGHNARNVLREASSLKSQKNDEFWRAAQLGLPLPPLKPAFAYDKFIGMLHGSGIRTDQRGHVVSLIPLTDTDVKKMSAGEVQNEKLVRAKDLNPERGGLFDPATTGGTTGTRWSHIRLAEPVLNPLFAEPARRLLGVTGKQLDAMMGEQGGARIKKELNKVDPETREKELLRELKTAKGSRADDILKQIKYLRALKKQDLRPGDAYVLSVFPVVPPVMRPILPGKGGQDLVVGDANYLYQNMMLHNRVLNAQVKDHLLPPEEHATLRKNLHQAVGAVVGTHPTDNPKLDKRHVKGFVTHLTGKTTPKSSYFQRKLVKRQQDLSGRGTAAPDASLGIDEIGLPEEMLWTTFSKFVIARLVRQGFQALQAKEMLEKRHPAARTALEIEIRERPVMVNRAPTLHRYNVVGAYARPVPGKTIRVNPFIEKGMNLDFDGDTLQVHTPALPAAVEDVKKMTLSSLLFADQRKDDLLVAPTMESVMGISLASQGATSKPVQKFKTKADAMAAYKAGKLSLRDTVDIG